MGRPRRRTSLRWKWTFAILAAALLPMLVAVWLADRIERKSLERAEAELQIAVVDELAESIVRERADAQNSTTEIGRLISDSRFPEDGRLALAQERLGRSTDLDAVALYADDGEHLGSIVRAGATEDGLPKSLPTTWADATWQTASGELLFVAALVDDGVRHGWVVGKATHGALERDVTSLAEARFGSRGTILVADRSFHVIAGPDSGPVAIGKNVRGRDAFTGLDATALGAGVATFRTFRDDDGRPMVATTRTIPDRGWAIVVRRSEADAFPELGALRRTLLLALAVVAAFAVALGTFLAARTTRPVGALVELTRAYAERRFSARSQVDSGDELEELGDAMTSMAGALETSDREIRRRAAIEAGLARYLPREVAEQVAAGETELRLGGERRYVAVLFADVASFTTFAEDASPEEAVGLLNELFALLSEVVFRHDGMVDKFMGDCVMAVFGAGDEREPADVRRAALEAAEDMHRFVEAAAPEWLGRFGFELKLGIGVASGDAVVGNLGGEARVEFTAIGDVVNIASRLEGAAQPGQTLCTADAARDVDPRYLQSMGSQPLRGKQRPVEIFRALP